MKTKLFDLGIPHYITIETEEGRNCPEAGCDSGDYRGRKLPESIDHSPGFQSTERKAEMELSS